MLRVRFLTLRLAFSSRFESVFLELPFLEPEREREEDLPDFFFSSFLGDFEREREELDDEEDGDLLGFAIAQ